MQKSTSPQASSTVRNLEWDLDEKPEVLSCDRCGITSRSSNSFLSKRSMSLKRMQICPECEEKKEKRLFSFLLWQGVTLTFLGLLLGMLYGVWFVFNIGLFPVFLIALILPHEFGHWLMARLLGIPVIEVSLGAGRPLGKMNILGDRWVLRAVPRGGEVMAAFTRRKWFRIRLLLFAFAGPLANLCLLVVSLVLLFLGKDSFSFLFSPEPLIALAGTNALLLSALIPFSVSTRNLKSQPSDGLQMVLALFLKEEQIDELLAMGGAFRSLDLLANGKIAAAQKIAAEAKKLAPEQPLWVLFEGIVARQKGDAQTSRELLLEHFESSANGLESRAIIASQIALAALDLDQAEFLAEADELSGRAMEILPWVDPVRGIRGQTLVELGRVEEGLKWIDLTLPTTEGSVEVADLLSSRASARFQQGDPEAGQQDLKRAADLDPENPTLKRVRARFLSSA